MALSAVASSRDKQDAYFSAQGFDRDPFSDDNIQGLFFPGGKRKKAVDELLHYSRYASSPLLLSGIPGCGKSTILKEFLRHTEPDVDAAIVDVEIMLSEYQIMEQVIGGFRIQPGSDELMEQLYRWLREQSIRQRLAVLCFDNAQNLSAEFLGPFFELTADPSLSLKLVFAADPDFGEVLESLSAHNDLLLHSVEVDPFSEEQVAKYARYRLSAAGYNGESPFSDMQIRAATLRCRGNISHLNDLLRDMMVAGADIKVGRHGRLPLFHLCLVLVVSALVLYLVMRSGGSDEFDNDLPIVLEQVEPSQSRVGEIAPDQKDHSSVPSLKQKLVAEGDNASAVKREIIADNEVTAVEKLGLLAKKAEQAEVAADQNMASESLEPTEMNERAAESTTADSGTIGGTTATADSADRPVVAVEQLPQTDEQAETALAQEPVIQAPPADNETDEQRPTTSQPRVEQEAVYRRLNSWPDSGYALQVFGTHNAQRARKLVEQYFGVADLLFYETLHNGKPWYVVINGPYSGRKSAQRSIESLPDSLRRLRPWPRNVASIKSDIERYRSLVR